MRSRHSGSLSRTLGFLYAATAFAGTFAFFTCLVLFLGNLPRRSDPWLWPSVDVGPATDPVFALLANFALVALFGLQHSLMARPTFKRRLDRLIPQPLERATYVHAANFAGFLLLAFWQPIPEQLWVVDGGPSEALLWTLFGAGWLLLLAGAWSINLLELLGLRQALYWWRGRSPPGLELKTGGLFATIAHPMYAGVILGLWATPSMSVGHAYLAALLTGYIVIAMKYERRDLARRFGRTFEEWQAAPAAPDSGAVQPSPESGPASIAVLLELPMECPPARMTELISRLRAQEAAGKPAGR